MDKGHRSEKASRQVTLRLARERERERERERVLKMPFTGLV